MPILLYAVRSPERMMVYKYWNSTTVRVRCYFSIQLLSTLTYSPRHREDLEFLIGSKVAVWKSKISCRQAEERQITRKTLRAHHAGGGASLVGGVSDGQYYHGAKGSGGYSGAQKGYPPTPDRY